MTISDTPPLVVEPGWEPSLDVPLPVMRCVAVTDPDTLDRCGKWSVRGLSTCVTHSGYEDYPSVRVYVDSALESARLRLLGMVDIALDAAVDMLGEKTRDTVRLRAVELVLDRAGVTPPPQRQEIEVNVTHSSSSADILVERLTRLARQSPELEAELVAEVVSGNGNGGPVDGFGATWREPDDQDEPGPTNGEGPGSDQNGLF